MPFYKSSLEGNKLFADDKLVDKALDDICAWLGFDGVDAVPLYLDALETEKADIFKRAIS